jgi:preprotein translocase subunit YajC
MSPFLTGLLAQEQPNSPTWFTYLPLAFIFVIFYFLMIAPMRKQARQQAELLGNLKKNDKIVTSSGIIGWVVQVGDGDVVLKVDKNNANFRITVLKSTISQVLVDTDAAKEATA